MSKIKINQDRKQNNIIKISLDAEGYNLMMNAINDLNQDGYLYISINDFVRMSIRFFTEVIINAEDTGVAFKHIKKKDMISRYICGTKKNNMLAVNINDSLLDLINKAVETIKEDGVLCDMTAPIFTRVCIIYFSKYAMDKQMGLTFRPGKLK